MQKNLRYKEFTLHSPRRTYLSKLYNSGHNIVDLMAISGHSNPSVFLGYIGERPKGNAKSILKSVGMA